MVLRYKDVFRSWYRILKGQATVLALEITNKCPLSCPGCYAYQPGHVSGAALETIRGYRGEELVSKILDLLDRKRPLGVFLVGGEPLLCVKELKVLLPEICSRRIDAEIVTSGVIPIPSEWNSLPGVRIVVSIDGLQPDHDLRRKPATYERILRNIEGRKIIVHCTVTSQMASCPDSLNKFLEFWSQRPEVGSIRISLYTPQAGEVSPEILSAPDRAAVISGLADLSTEYPKLRINPRMLESYKNPPASPRECIFSNITECLSADLKSPVTPCQLGGIPDCSQCGCVAAVGLEAVGRYRLPGGITLRQVFRLSNHIGRRS